MNRSNTLTGRLLAGVPLESLPLMVGVLACGAASAAAELEEHRWSLHGFECGCLEARHELFARPTDPMFRRGFDPETGRGLLNLPPTRWAGQAADITHVKVHLRVEDMNTPRLDATASLRFSAPGSPIEELVLDARGFTIHSVDADGRSATHEYDGRTIRVRLDPPLPVGGEGRVQIEYTVVDPPNGLFWTPEDPAWPGRPAQIHTQGQPETNSFWFPVHDFPNERLTTEIIAEVPAGYTVSSNGRLVSQERFAVSVPDASGVGRLTGFERFHWAQDALAGGEHAPYLVSLIIGQFDVADLGDDRIPMPVYVPPGRAGDIERTYGNTARMMAFFEELFDEPYPWDRYAQLVVHNFVAGGMENTGASTMHDTAIFHPGAEADHDLDGLISHELAHQWFGDLMTCRSWEHIWLNEGFATYSTALWFEERDGEPGYAARMLGAFDSVAANDTGSAPETPGLTSAAYRHPWEVFRRGSNPYPKGASVLHMLRQRLGDRVFFHGLREYLDRHRGEAVETDQFRRVLEDVSGESLEWFFDQWTLRPNIPRLEVAITPAREGVRVRIEQTQPIDQFNPAFRFDLPLHFVYEDGPDRVEFVPVSERVAEAVIPHRGGIRFVSVDPERHVLSEVSVEQPGGWAWTAAQDGATILARVRAVRQLADGPRELGRLEQILRTSAEPRVLRREAAAALGRHGAVTLLNASLRAGLSDPYVREAATSALGAALADRDGLATPRQRAGFDTLDELAAGDHSTIVRSAAVRALAGAAMDEADLVMRAADSTRVLLGTDSQHDGNRRAAIAAARTLNLPELLEPVLAFSRPGNHSRTRPAALDAAATMASFDRERVLEVAIDRLSSRERRTYEAAGRALVTLGGEDALGALRAKLATARDDREREQLEGWIAAIDG